MDIDTPIGDANDTTQVLSGLPLANQIAEYRVKLQRGELTREDMKEVIKLLRAGRLTAASAPKKASASVKAKAATINTDDLLKDFLS